jgi:hypothetical protein
MISILKSKRFWPFFAQLAITCGALAQAQLPACPLTGLKHNCLGEQIFYGNKYIGGFKDGKFHGGGTLTLSTGSKYVGEFKDGLRTGKGTYIFADGAKYVGEFKDGEFDGRGIEYLADGSEYRAGVWKHGFFAQSAQLQPSALSSAPSPDTLNIAALSEVGAVCQTQVSPVMPRDAQRSGVGGEVRAQLRVKNGAVTEVTILSGPNIFHEPVRAAGMQYKCAYKTTEVLATQKFNFRIEGNGQDLPRTEAEYLRQVELASSQAVTRLPVEAQAAAQRQRELDEQPKQTRPQTQALSPPPVSPAIAHALIIGNGAYAGSGRLDNPVNDAKAMSRKLRNLGFTVTEVNDANRAKLVNAFAQFSRTAASAEITLLFYSGHGVQIYGTNYVLPIDVDQNDIAQATLQGVSLNSVIEQFMPGKTKLVFLDACRDNPLVRTASRGMTKGLAPISVAQGTLIAYSTKDGQVALDGVGQKNSPFTTALLDHLADPIDIAVVLRKVRAQVMQATGGKQEPWEYGSLTGGELILSSVAKR